MSYASLATKLKESVESVQTSEDEIQVVYGHVEGDKTGYPAVEITPAGNEEDAILDQQENERFYNFRITVLDELGSGLDTRNEIDVRLMGIADDIIDEIDSADYSSIGIIFKPKIFAGEWGYRTIGEGHARAFELIVQFRKTITVGQ